MDSSSTHCKCIAAKPSSYSVGGSVDPYLGTGDVSPPCLHNSIGSHERPSICATCVRHVDGPDGLDLYLRRKHDLSDFFSEVNRVTSNGGSSFSSARFGALSLELGSGK